MTKKQQKHFLHLVSKNKIKETIEGLMEIDFNTPEKKVLTGIAAQYQQWQQKKHNGVLSSEQESLQYNQITTRLIDFISQPEQKASISETDFPQHPHPSFWQKKGVRWLGIIGSLASIIALYFVFFPPNNDTTKPKTVTVLVHGKKGKDDLVLPNRGMVYLIYGDAKIPEQINNEGEATFKQIPNAFFSKKAKVEILFEDPEGENYRTILPDSLYHLKEGSHIALEVVLEGMEQIQGIVKDFETGQSIDSATIRVFGKEVYSNRYGEFTLDIPEDQQQKFINLRVFKEGYEDWEMSDLPTATDREIVIPLKSSMR